MCCYRSRLVFSDCFYDTDIWQGSVATHLKWNNFENRLIFGKAKVYRKNGAKFLGHPVDHVSQNQRAQNSAERQHNMQCKLAMQLWSESTVYFFDNPVNPDFGLRTPGSGRWSGSSPKFKWLKFGDDWSLGHALPLQDISSKSVHNFFSYPTDRQTDKQTEVKT